jgi:hypothetical protein
VARSPGDVEAAYPAWEVVDEEAVEVSEGAFVDT